ncbi:uncharacterized protein LOC134458605 [Engraulis encrasicolus]|uniref:uncharacterized protein LOC134458605 n=1 Tax=Engraulis encrasicolus TaxID=184585 RepID=UPI002FD4F740
MRLRLETWLQLLAVSSVAVGEQYLKSVEIGKPVTLFCDGKGSPDDMEITWKTPHQLVASCSKGHLSVGPGFENRVRFENEDGEVRFSLHINPTVFSDSDTYSCFRGTVLIRTLNLIVTVSPPKEVEVIERGRVTLPCYGIINRRLADEQLNVLWKKDGYVVLNLTKGATHHYPGFGYRANIFLDGIRKGDMSMEIRKVELTDAGNYECSTENGEGKILSSVSLRVHKGIHHGYRERVLSYTGDSFIFYITSEDADVYHLDEKTNRKTGLCWVRDGVVKCSAHKRERIVMEQGYLTLKDLTEDDTGVYQVRDARDIIITEIVLEVGQLYSKGPNHPDGSVFSMDHVSDRYTAVANKSLGSNDLRIRRVTEEDLALYYCMGRVKGKQAFGKGTRLFQDHTIPHDDSVTTKEHKSEHKNSVTTKAPFQTENHYFNLYWLLACVRAIGLLTFMSAVLAVHIKTRKTRRDADRRPPPNRRAAAAFLAS